MIRNERHFYIAMAYIENNPVRAGLCIQANQWTWGSASATHLLADESNTLTGSAGVPPASSACLATATQHIASALNGGPQAATSESDAPTGSAGVPPASSVHLATATPNAVSSPNRGEQAVNGTGEVPPPINGDGRDARAPSACADGENAQAVHGGQV
jgi:hypothetical protein